MADLSLCLAQTPHRLFFYGLAQNHRRRSLFTNPKGFEAHEDTNNTMYIHGDGRNSIDMH